MEQEELEYVGFWARLLAALIDTVALMAVLAPLAYVVYGEMTAPLTLTAGSLFLNFVVPAVLSVVLWIKLGATPGKLALSARIVDADTGLPLTPGKAVVRYLGYFVSTVPLCMGFIWIGLDRRKQGWHDKLANSVVVRPKVKAVKFPR